MIRRPRYPLTLRLGWLESEIGSAAKLAHMLVTDMKALIGKTEGVEARLMMVATVCCAALVPLGVNPRTLEAFVEHLVPGGDLEMAETLAGEIIMEVMAVLAGEEEEVGPEEPEH